MSAVDEADFRAWEGWVHSRARTLVLGMQARCDRRAFAHPHSSPGGGSTVMAVLMLTSCLACQLHCIAMTISLVCP